MLLSFSVDSVLKHCLSWVSLCTPQWKCSMAVGRSWLWGCSILMIMPQFVSVTVDHSVRYSFQKGKGETFFPDMHSVHQAGRDSLPEAGVISTRCYIHQGLYPPGVVSTRCCIYQVVLCSLGCLSSPHIPNFSLFPGLCPCCYCHCFVFVVGLVWFCVVWNFSEVIWGKYLLTSGAKEKDDSSQIWLNEIISVNRIVFRCGGNFPSRWRAEVFLLPLPLATVQCLHNIRVRWFSWVLVLP